MSGGKTPRWECELWSCISNSDGENCPVYDCCRIRRSGGYCISDSREQLKRLPSVNQSSAFINREFVQNYALTGCVPPGRIFRLVEMLAQRYLNKGKVHSPPVPTDLILLADEQHPIEIRLLPLKAYHGGIWRLREGWIIQLKDGDTSASQRFTLFHEAFHILAYCKTTPMFRKRGIYRGYFNELLADHFTCCILMPRKWVEEKWAEVKNIDRMTEIFDVTPLAMWFRLKCLHLV